MYSFFFKKRDMLLQSCAWQSAILFSAHTKCTQVIENTAPFLACVSGGMLSHARVAGL
jgi:hypothetical protein